MYKLFTSWKKHFLRQETAKPVSVKEEYETARLTKTNDREELSIKVFVSLNSRTLQQQEESTETYR